MRTKKRDTTTETVGGEPVAIGFETRPEAPIPPEPADSSLQRAEHPYINVDIAAAEILVDTVFGGTPCQIPGLRYATAYKLAEGQIGGDIIDVFHYDNDHVSIAVADIAGKGTQAAVHAAMIKYGLRAFVSNGSTPEKTIRALDRLYLENNAHERTESFATVFLGIVDDSRRSLHYTNAALECALLVHPNGEAIWLPPTAPLVGVFDDQHHLFKQQFTVLAEGSLLVLATDGVSEARNRKGETFGCEPIKKAVLAQRHDDEAEIAQALLRAVEAFTDDRRRDDIAILVARFL
jgi:sigma-B regulation protein RsbU (phosphoserine phosphatase)